jgi:hypothetical protein
MALVPFDIQPIELLGMQAFQALLTGLADKCYAALRHNARDCIDLLCNSSSMGTWMTLLFLLFAIILSTILGNLFHMTPHDFETFTNLNDGSLIS